MNVYKYRFGSKRDLDSLQQNYFYAPNSLELNDPYEGIFIDEILDATGLHHLFKNDFSRFYKEVLCTRQISQNPYPIRILPS